MSVTLQHIDGRVIRKIKGMFTYHLTRPTCRIHLDPNGLRVISMTRKDESNFRCGFEATDNKVDQRDQKLTPCNGSGKSIDQGSIDTTCNRVDESN